RSWGSGLFIATIWVFKAHKCLANACFSLDREASIIFSGF
ncbi:MAG: hypothetical protein ACI9MF_002933, partial [Gammaproteobacteria bacterium]